MEKGFDCSFRRGLGLILATDANFNIGKDGNMLFWIPEDLKRFKEITMGKNLYMGRKTFESTGPLEGRKMIVLSKNTIENADCVMSDKDAFRDRMKKDDKGMLIGGGKMVEMFYDDLDYILLTTTKKSFDADTGIEDPLKKGFKIIHTSEWYNYNGLEYRYVDYVRDREK